MGALGHTSAMGFPRPLAALVSVVLLIVLGLVALLPDCASACSCVVLPSTPQERVREELSESDAAFSGEVVQIDRPSLALSGADRAKVTFRVYESWKGPERRTLEVSTPVFEASCGYSFEEGQEYLVFAYGGQGHLKVDACGETERLSRAGDHLAALGDGEVPADVGELSDTSGGISARAMAGLAGLTLAASFALVLRLMRTDVA